MPFVITGLSRAWKIKSDITVLVLSYCDSIKLMIIYDLILSNCYFKKKHFTYNRLQVYLVFIQKV